MTDWLEMLREECERTSQEAAGRRIGYSGSTVNQVLAGKYKGDLRAIEKAVSGALMSAVVECPVLGSLATNRCIEEQRRPLVSTNPLRVRLYKACRAGCPHSRIGGTPHAE